MYYYLNTIDYIWLITVILHSVGFEHTNNHLYLLQFHYIVHFPCLKFLVPSLHLSLNTEKL